MESSHDNRLTRRLEALRDIHTQLAQAIAALDALGTAEGESPTNDRDAGELAPLRRQLRTATKRVESMVSDVCAGAH